MKSKQAKSLISTSIIILIVSFLAISPLLFVQATGFEIGNYYFEDYKMVEYNNVVIAAEKMHHCEYKPDGENDGYKKCSPEVVVWNRRDNPISLDMIKDKFDFSLTKAYKNGKLDLYYSTNYEIYNFTKENITEVEDTLLDGTIITKLNIEYYNVSKIGFTNWKSLDDLTKELPPNKIVGIRFEFELPQYESAFYNFTYKPLNWVLDPDVTACGILNTAGATYTQTANILDNGLSDPCIIITNSNITYNGNGYTIRSNDVEAGIYSNSPNTTIQHTDISMSTASGSGFGVYLSGAHNSTIYNNTLSDELGGVLLTTGTLRTNITGNTMSGNTYGIYIYDTLSDSNLIHNNSVSSTSQGLRIDGDLNTISNNTLTGNSFSAYIFGDYNTLQNNTITYIQRGVALQEGTYNEVSWNTISNSTHNAGDYNRYGVSMESEASYNLIKSNILSDTAARGITISSGDYNNVTNNTINYGRWGLMTYDADSNILSNNILTNQTDSSIHLDPSSRWNIFINITSEIYKDMASNGAVTITGTSTDNVFQDSTFTTNQTLSIAVVGSSTNNTFLNCTYATAENVTAGSELIRKWHFYSQINNSLGSPINLANVTGFSQVAPALNQTYVFSVLAGLDGKITTQSLIEYINNATMNYHTNHTINVSKTGFTINSTIYNLSIETNINHLVTLSDSNSPIVTITYPEEIVYDYNTSLPLNYTPSDAETAVDSCWFKVINSTSDLIVDNITITSCLNTTFNISQGTGTYNLTLYLNDSENNLGSSEVEFSILLTAPTIILDAPIDFVNLTDGTDVYFNYTGTDGNGLSTCQFWHNATGIWHKNYTWIGPTSAVQNYTTQNITEGRFKWNVWCNDTTNQGNWSLTNNTITIDKTTPIVNITTANGTTIANSFSITVGYNISDTYLKQCYFSLRDSNRTLHNYAENTSFSCSLYSRSISTLNYGIFTLQMWGEDYSGNLNHTNITWTSVYSEQSSGGGGTETVVEVVRYENRTHCGDLICQNTETGFPTGNDFNIQENYWNCQQDCSGAVGENLDELVFSLTSYCFDKDPSTVCAFTQLFSTIPGTNITDGADQTIVQLGQVCVDGTCEQISVKTLFTNCMNGEGPCFFNTKLGFFILFGIGGGLLAISFIKIKSPESTKKVNPYSYVVLRARKGGRKKRYKI